MPRATGHLSPSTNNCCPKMDTTKFLRTNEREEAVRSLEWAAGQAKCITGDAYYWKWVITSLHNASQGFMVLALWNGNGLLSMPKKVASEWLEAHKSGKPYPKDSLDTFLNLYKKSKIAENFNFLGSSAYAATAIQDSSFSDLNRLRNEFIHFTPKGWSLNLVGLPDMVLDVLDLIEYFGWKSSAILWHEPSLKTRARWAHRSLSRTMKTLEKNVADTNRAISSRNVA
jgi:hypothetical protein